MGTVAKPMHTLKRGNIHLHVKMSLLSEWAAFSGLFLNSPTLQYRPVLHLLESLLLEADFFKTVNDTVCSELPMQGFGSNTPTGRKGSL